MICSRHELPTRLPSALRGADGNVDCRRILRGVFRAIGTAVGWLIRDSANRENWRLQSPAIRLVFRRLGVGHWPIANPSIDRLLRTFLCFSVDLPRIQVTELMAARRLAISFDFGLWPALAWILSGS